MSATEPDSTSAPLDAQHVLDERLRTGITVGLSAVILSGDETRFYNAGQRARSSATAVDEHTLYEIGSVTKVFTALLLADMAERDEVGWDDPIDEYLPAGIKPPQRDGHAITLRQLAQHTSALPRLPDNLKPGDNPQDPYADYTEEKLFAFLDGYQPERTIGEKYQYSNLGAGLLGALLARRAATDYDTHVRQRICKPLGMTATTGDLNDTVRKHLATGHHGAREVPCWNLAALAGCGDLRSSTADLARFLRAQLDPSKLTGSLPAAIRACLDRKAEIKTDLDKTTVTLGWHVTETDGGTVYWHNGGTGGYRSFIGLDFDKQRAVAVLSNSVYSVDDVGMHLLDPANPLDAVQPFAEVGEDKLRGHLGKYMLSPLHIFDITLENGQLFAQLTAQEALPLWPESELRFFYREVDAQITFERDDKGKTTALVLHQHDLNQRAPRIPTPQGE